MLQYYVEARFNTSSPVGPMVAAPKERTSGIPRSIRGICSDFRSESIGTTSEPPRSAGQTSCRQPRIPLPVRPFHE